MNNKKLAIVLTLTWGLVLSALVFTAGLWKPVQAQEEYITIIKGPDQAILSGATATFDITVTNNSTGILTNVTVTDPLAADCNRLFGNLDPGESRNYTCSEGGVTADYTNVATVEGRTSGTGAFDVSDDDSANVDVINPSISIAKTPDSQTVADGDRATFAITVTNTGDSVLSDVTVTDPQASACNRVFASLGVGASENYTCDSPPVDVSFNNTAMVVGTTLADTEVTDSDDAYVNVINPSIEIAKTPDSQVVVINEDASFHIVVTNIGDATLTNVMVEDAETENCNYGPVTLAPDESVAYDCVAEGVAADFTNTAVVSGTPPVGDAVVDSDTADVDVIAPNIGIDKTPEERVISSGSSADFTIVVANSGDVPLTNVIVSDPSAPDCSFGPVSLNPTQSMNHSCTVANVTEGLLNIATVSGEPPTGDAVTASASAQVFLAETQNMCPADMFTYWKLDEASGNVYNDLYSGYDVTCDGQCPTATGDGALDGAQTFNGINTGLSLPPVPEGALFDWDTDDSFSIELWMRADQAGSCSGDNQVIIGRNGDATPYWWVGCWLDGEAGFVLRDRNGNRAEKWLHGTTDLSSDTDWHHIVAIRDASAGEIRLYVDGNLEDSSPAAYSANFDSPTAALNIGWLDQRDGFHFAGSVDEVALYSRALPVSEIQQHYYENQMSGRGYCETELLAPTIFSTPVTETVVQRPYTYDVDAIGNPPPLYTLTVTPTGMTIDPVTGLISWKPVVTQQGSHAVQVEAGNSEGTDTQDFIIEVEEGPLCSDNTVAYWKLEEVGGAIFADYYDGNDAVCDADADECPNPTIEGQVDNAQMFLGSDELNAPADDSFNWGVDDSFSIEFWMQADPGACSGNRVVVGRNGDANPYWWVGCWDNGTAGFVLRDEDGTIPSRWLNEGTTNLTLGGWHHVVAVRDASAGEIRLYVDSVEEDSVSVVYSAGFSSTAALNIGWLNQGGGGYYFAGTLDELALYNKALNQDEIEQHYNRGQDYGAGYCVNPEVSISKAATPPTAYSGSLITYTYTVFINDPGDDPLSDVSVRDDHCSVPATPETGDSLNSGVLDLSEFWTYRCYTTLDQDTTNTAVVEGVYSLGGVVSDTATASVNIINPAISMDKQVTPTLIYAGDTVTYTFTVTNPGDDPLSFVGISDDQCSPDALPVTGDNNQDEKLDPGETWTYICATILNTDAINTAIVTGTDSLGGIVDDEATVSVNVINPDINIDKQANPGVIYAGKTVTYTYSVTNPQAESLMDLSVSDDVCDEVNFVGGDADLDDELDPNETETWTYTCSMELFEDTTNVATVIGNDPLSGVVSDTAVAFVNVINPDVSIDKRASSPTIYAGDAVTYTYSVINPGDDPLAGVDVGDDHCSPVTFAGGDNNQDNKLNPGETWVHTCSMTLLADTTNTAIVTGTDSLHNVVIATATVSVNVLNPDINLGKQANAEMVRVGETVTYTYTVVNPRNDPLTSVSVSDDRCSTVSFVDGDDDLDDELDAGETWTYVCSMALFTDTTNIATAVGTDALQDVVSDTATAFVSVINPAISIDKQASATEVNAGDTVTYTYTVVNSGDDTLAQVNVSDDQCSPVAFVGSGNPGGEMLPAETWTYACSMELLTHTTNVALVTAIDSLDRIVSDTDTVTVLVGAAWYRVYLPLVLSDN